MTLSEGRFPPPEPCECGHNRPMHAFEGHPTHGTGQCFHPDGCGCRRYAKSGLVTLSDALRRAGAKSDE